MERITQAQAQRTQTERTTQAQAQQTQPKDPGKGQKERLGATSSNGTSNSNSRQLKFISFFINDGSGLSEQHTKQSRASKSKNATSNLIDDTGKRSPHTSDHGDGNRNNDSRQPRFISFILSNLQVQSR